MVGCGAGVAVGGLAVGDGTEFSVMEGFAIDVATGENGEGLAAGVTVKESAEALAIVIAFGAWADTGPGVLVAPSSVVLVGERGAVASPSVPVGGGDTV